MKVEELKEFTQGIEGIDAATVEPEELAVIAAKTNVGYILFKGDEYFDETLGKLLSSDANASGVFETCRLRAAQAIANAHDIALYSCLRRAIERDDSVDVRAAAKASASALEKEFGEDACLDEYEHFTGGLDKYMDSEEAHLSGNFYSGNLNDFR